LILDTSGPHLVAALAERPYIVRLNHLEAQELVGGGIDPAGVAHTASVLLARGAAEAVIVTLGEHGAFIASAGGRVHIRPPRVPTVSMVGAGDSFIGALALGLVRDWPVEEAARFGVAAAAAAVSTPAGELCDRETTERYFEATAGMVEHFEDVLAPAG
jgi:6-phosphofructokinase 2